MKPETLICISSFFTFWGDRMWTFSTGLFLIQLTPGSLRLAAIFGLVLSVTAIIFSPMIGDWIDRNLRLKVVRLLLFSQNLLVVICAVLIYLAMKNNSNNLDILFQVLIIVTASSANLSSQGQKIAVGKDWVVVVCKGDKDLLAFTNALVRRIDLTVAILAPLAVGFLMAFISVFAGIIFIVVWNLVSVFVEYGLLLKVYNQVPALRNKKDAEPNFDLELDGMQNYAENECDTETLDKTGSVNSPDDASLDKNESAKVVKKIKGNWNPLLRLRIVISGWKVYYRQSVFLAGCTLAILFLTVLGFNNITIGFAYEQGLNELYVSICMGLGSVVGVIGTFLFPMIRHKVGLVKTGIVGFFCQWTMLLLCGLSIWLPGSPSTMYSGPVYRHSRVVVQNISAVASSNITQSQETVQAKDEKILTSIIMLMVGITLSRTGLWLSDLTITQLQQEYVLETERGIVGGVQYSMNCVFDVAQYVVTIFLSKPSQFGILTLISISAVTLSGIVYLIFVSKFKPPPSDESEEVNGDSGKKPVTEQLNGDSGNIALTETEALKENVEC